MTDRFAKTRALLHEGVRSIENDLLASASERATLRNDYLVAITELDVADALIEHLREFKEAATA